MVYYRQMQANKFQSIAPTETGGKLILTQTSDKLGGFASVLGANITTALESGQSYLAEVSGGASEPIINELVSKTQETLKNLPKKEAEKIKYEFCRGIVEEYETKSSRQ
jgi:hypothetical protein